MFDGKEIYCPVNVPCPSDGIPRIPPEFFPGTLHCSDAVSYNIHDPLIHVRHALLCCEKAERSDNRDFPEQVSPVAGQLQSPV